MQSLHAYTTLSLSLPCSYPGCRRWFKGRAGLTYHKRSRHPSGEFPEVSSDAGAVPDRLDSNFDGHSTELWGDLSSDQPTIGEHGSIGEHSGSYHYEPNPWQDPTTQFGTLPVDIPDARSVGSGRNSKSLPNSSHHDKTSYSHGYSNNDQAFSEPPASNSDGDYHYEPNPWLPMHPYEFIPDVVGDYYEPNPWHSPHSSPVQSMPHGDIRPTFQHNGTPNEYVYDGDESGPSQNLAGLQSPSNLPDNASQGDVGLEGDYDDTLSQHDEDVPAQGHCDHLSDHHVSEDEPRQHSSRPKFTRIYHPFIDGQICDKDGGDIPPGTPPTPRESDRGPDDWTPYSNRTEFEVADFLFRRNQMSAGDMAELFEMWTATLVHDTNKLPFSNSSSLYKKIDATPLGDVAWENFTVSYDGPRRPENPDDVPSWMKVPYETWYRDPRKLINNMIGNPDFDGEFDTTPFHEYDADHKHRFQNFMSGDWAWEQANIIANDPATRGSMFVPIILGSDATTVSVATGHNQYWPVYMSIGNIHNTTRRARRNGVVLLCFLPIPKTDKEHQDDPAFRRFRRQLFHTSLSQALQPLYSGMTKPEVVRCPDGHFRRAIYGLGPYIADYPEQALLACIVQGWCGKCLARPKDLDGGARVPRCLEHTSALVELIDLGPLWAEYGLVGDIVPFTEDFPRADIHELLAPDILHQLVKGTFKDHLVTWVNEYLVLEHGEQRANKILDDIDQRIATVPPFAGLRRFPQGRGFKQWTGDDSKALMKVYLPAIEGHVPADMVRALRAFLEFCYIARREVHDTESLQALKDALDRFHHYREIFMTTGVRPNGFNLPRQHSLVHYFKLIRAFGAPNEPWRRSNRYNALGQMLLTNQRLDKLAASRVDFKARGMLNDTLLSSVLATTEPRADGTVSAVPVVAAQNNIDSGGRDKGDHNSDDDGDDDGVYAHVKLARTITQRNMNVSELAGTIDQPDLVYLIRRFLQQQLSPNANTSDSSTASESRPLPFFNRPISVYPSSIATFYAPSDPCGTRGMHRERIRAVPSWRRGPGRYDCMLIETDPNAPGMRGLDVAQARLFFSFSYRGKFYPCALVHWFSHVGDEPDENTGMWMVERQLNADGSRHAGVLHLDTIVRAAHLIGVYGETYLQKGLTPANSLDKFPSYYVNKYIDHHSFETLF